MIEVEFLTEVYILDFPATHTFEKKGEGFGYKISAPGLRHHTRLVARVCQLAISVHKAYSLIGAETTKYKKHVFMENSGLFLLSGGRRQRRQRANFIQVNCNTACDQ